MLTLDALRRFGANTGEGLARCLNDEGFYLELVKMELGDEGFEKLASSLERGTGRQPLKPPIPSRALWGTWP